MMSKIYEINKISSKVSNYCSAYAPVHLCVPRVSVLGPILFFIYIKPLSSIINSYSITHHSFADNL